MHLANNHSQGGTMKFTRKGHGRIYVKDAIDIPKVNAIIKEMDEFEYEYLPNNMITTYERYPETVYIGKFDELKTDVLTNICWKTGICIWCYDEGNEYDNM